MISKTERDRINIQRLIIEAPKQEDIRFNPKEEFSEPEFESILSWLDLNKYTGANTIYPNAAYQLAVLFPDRKQDLKLDTKAMEIVFGYVGATLGGWENLRALQNVKMLFPKFFGEIPYETDPNIQESIKDMREEPWDGEMVLAAAALKIVYPKRFEEIGLTIEDYKKLKKQFEGYFASNSLWASLRIMFPEVPKNQFQTVDQLKEKKRSLLHTSKDFTSMWGWERYLNDAYELAILTADKLEIDENGIKIIPKTVTFEDKDMLPQPEARKF